MRPSFQSQSAWLSAPLSAPLSALWSEALSYILDDEKLEVTPKRIAMRKARLSSESAWVQHSER